jgi:hypothetical protein
MKNLRLLFSITSVISVGVLTYEITGLQTDILSPVYYLILFLIAITITSFIFGGISKLLLEKISFKTIFYFLFTLLSILSILYIHRPSYKVIVPDNYIGDVNLILSNVKENKLELDANGIGYINLKTFNKTFIPIILQNGIEINNRAVGFSKSGFWGKAQFSTNDGKTIQSLRFQIVPDHRIREKQNYHKDLSGLINNKLIHFQK